MAATPKQPKALTGKRLRFVLEYLKDGNATQAAIRAGYSAKSAGRNADRLMKNDEIAAGIAQKEAEIAKKAGVSVEMVLTELRNLALCDINDAFDEDGAILPLREMKPEVRRCISGIEVESIWDGDKESGRFESGKVHKFKFWPKDKALELIGKHLKMYTDKQEHSGNISIVVEDPYAGLK